MVMSDQQIAGLGALPSRFDEVDQQLRKILAAEKQLQDTLAVVLQVQGQQGVTLQQILDAVVEPPSATTFVIKESATPSGSKENKMKKHSAGIDIAILINGTGIATISSITDVNGNPVSAPQGLSVPAWSSTNPAALQVVPAADGMSAALTGLSAATAVVLTADSKFVDANGVTQDVTGDGDPIDIAAAPPGAAAKFVITESAS